MPLFLWWSVSVLFFQVCNLSVQDRAEGTEGSAVPKVGANAPCKTESSQGFKDHFSSDEPHQHN